MNLFPYYDRRIVVLLLTFLSTDVFAQEPYTITAKVQNREGLSIDIGNALILSVVDSTLVRGSVFYDGQFSIENIGIRHFLLRVSSLGYKDHMQEIHLQETSHILEPIILMREYLDEVVIRANRQLIERRGTDIIVNVAHTSLSNAGTITDVLQNTPKVDINRNGQISVLGKGQASVFVDGQQVASTQILNSLSSLDVVKVEILENPPASFDAAGNAVINIITKTKTLEGYKLGFTQEAGYGEHFRSYFQANGYLKIKNIMVQGDYGVRPQTLGSWFRQARTYLGDADQYFTDSRYLLTNEWLGQNYSLSSAYILKNRMSLGVNYSGSYGEADKTGKNHRIGEVARDRILDIGTLVTGITARRNNTATIYLKSNAEKSLTYLLQGQYADFGFGRNEVSEQDIESTGNIHRLVRKSGNANEISIYTLQLDFQKKMEHNLSLEWGAKNALITNSSSVGLDDLLDDGSTVPVPDFSNEFDYEENIMATYVQGYWNNDSNWSASVGFRGEWTRANSAGEEFADGVLERDYFNIFPSASLQYSPSEEIKTSLSYSYRINRPLFRDLNPYILYVDSLISLRGNAYLIPEYSHSIAASAAYKAWSLDFNFVRTNNKINQIHRSLNPDNPNIITGVKVNLDYTDLFMLSASGQINYKKYHANISLGGFYDKHNLQDFDREFSNRRFGYYLQFNQKLGLPWGLQLAGYMRYVSTRVDGVYIDDPMSYLNLSLSKGFMGDQLNVQLWFNDVWDDWRFVGISTFNNMYMDYVSQGDWHFFKLSLNWNFGKLNAAGLNEKRISKDELNRAEQGM